MGSCWGSREPHARVAWRVRLPFFWVAKVLHCLEGAYHPMVLDMLLDDWKPDAFAALDMLRPEPDPELRGIQESTEQAIARFASVVHAWLDETFGGFFADTHTAPEVAWDIQVRRVYTARCYPAFSADLVRVRHGV